MIYLWYILSTLAAWFVGLFIDINSGWNPTGILCLRVVLPIIVTGIWVLKSVRDGKKE